MEWRFWLSTSQLYRVATIIKRYFIQGIYIYIYTSNVGNVQHYRINKLSFVSVVCLMNLLTKYLIDPYAKFSLLEFGELFRDIKTKIYFLLSLPFLFSAKTL